MNKNFNIEQFLDLSTYATKVRSERRKGQSATNEYFTPYSIIKRMCDKISDEDWADPEKTFLESCAGNGQFVCYIIWNRLMHGIDWKTALETITSVELMEDNVQEQKERVLDMFDKMGIGYDEEVAREIMNKNFICSDFFEWYKSVQ